MAQGSEFRKLNLSPKERRFMAAFFRLGTRAAAYRQVSPNVTEDSAAVMGSRLYAKIVAKVDWPTLLALAELDDARLASELARKLTAKKSEFYQGEEVAIVEDNGTQMRAVELLADLLGKRQTDINVTNSTTAFLAALEEAHRIRQRGEA